MATLIFDLDGVIWRGENLVSPDIPAIIKRLERKGHRIYFLTNNSTLNQYGYQRKLARLGIKVFLNQIICSSNAARQFLEKKLENLKARSFRGEEKKVNVFVIGEKPLVREIERLKVRLVGVYEHKKVDYVIVGADWHLTYKKLERAAEAILEGAYFIATNNDKTYPVQGRRLRPGCGAIVAAIRASTNCRPYIVGKPNPFIIKGILKNPGLNRNSTYIIGDRLDTDILLANRSGLRSVLVLSGTTTEKMAEKAKGREKPEYIIRNLKEIEKILK